jgi:ribosome-associated protein
MTARTKNWHETETAASFLLAEEACWWILDRKGLDVTVLDLRGRSDVCDFFVIATGQADTQVKAIARAVRDGLGRAGTDPLHVEGQDEARWVLLDYVDVVVHVFQAEPRAYYNLERLWGDAPRLDVADDHFAAAYVRARHPRLSHSPPAAGPAGAEPEAP